MTGALEGDEWSAASPGRTLLPGKTRYPFYRRLGGPQVRSGRAENLVPTGIRSRTVQPIFNSICTSRENKFNLNCRRTTTSLVREELADFTKTVLLFKTAHRCFGKQWNLILLTPASGITKLLNIFNKVNKEGLFQTLQPFEMTRRLEFQRRQTIF